MAHQAKASSSLKLISKTVTMYCPPGSSGDLHYIPPHILVSLVCTGLRIVLPSRQYKDYGFYPPHILVSLVCMG